MNTARSNTDTLWLFGGWALLFLLGTWAYWPGLHGSFVFDDFGTIADLGDLGGVTDWNTFKAFVFGGHAGPTGRPLALLTFLIDANNWPTDAWPFKRTNLVIHLLNGALLGLLSERLLRILDMDARQACRVALIAAGAWLLHPFLVSTTLYAVQRMAQLSTLFVFAGLLGYLHGRMLVATAPRRAYLVMSASLVVGTVLAMLSKENGILLPLLAGVAEITIIASRKGTAGALNRYWSILFLVVPAVVIALYLGERLFRPDFFDVAANRDFSIYERLLTQARVLVDYLKHWFVPELYTTGVFQDHFLKSTGLLSPATTLLGIAFHAVVLGVLIARRRQWPLLAFAGLFFYGAQLIESTVLNLEMYFEHRNYLAAAFLLLPPAVLLHSKTSQGVFLAVSVVALLTLAGFTRYSADTWSEYPRMVEASARKAPTSARAQQQYAVQLFNAGQTDAALDVIERASTNIPGRPELLLTRLLIRCETGRLTAAEFEHAAESLVASPYDARTLDFYQQLSRSVALGSCDEISAANLVSLFARMLEQPFNTDSSRPSYSQIQFLLGLSHARLGAAEEAVAAFEQSLESRPGTGHAMIMAAVLADNSLFDAALHLSGIARQHLREETTGALEGARVSLADIADFENKVREEMQKPSSE